MPNGRRQFSCRVCRSLQPNYKCPACGIPYCCVKCFKTHKIEKGLEKCIPNSNNQFMRKDTRRKRRYREFRGGKGNNNPTWSDIDETEDRVDPLKLELLKTSEEVKEKLCNPHLRQILSFMDTANNKERFMENAMQEPIFVEFADACLKVIDEQPDKDEEVKSISSHSSHDDPEIEVQEFDLLQF